MSLLGSARWQVAASPVDVVTRPDELADAELLWCPAVVPGTSAAAVRSALGREAALRQDHDATDWWFTTTLERGCPAGSTLVLPGLASVVEVWVGDELVTTTTSMFTTTEVVLDEQCPGVLVAFRCVSLGTVLSVRRSRGRWRSSLVSQQGLRHQRTSFLGRAAMLRGSTAPVGPWRGMALHAPTEIRASEVHRTADLTTATARVRARVHGVVANEVVVIAVGDSRVTTVLRADGGRGLVLDASVVVAGARPWWPHTHGDQPLYPVALEVGDERLDLGVVGFRDVELDRTGGGVRPRLNGVTVFCRGAVWSPVDPVGHTADPEGTRAVLLRLRDAGLNTVRVPGTGVYEHEDFHRACAELGMMVWQDAMLATLDPVHDPDDPGDPLRAELVELCRARAGDPSLVVLSGGTETEQQPTFLGLPAEGRSLPLLTRTLPEVAASWLPGVPVLTSTPSGGVLPTHVGTGVSHWFGVGAYLRPLRDVREAGVRLAAECLAFSIPPEPAAVERHFRSAAVAGHDPVWKAAVPRDRGSSWDFEDVRDHYVRTALGVDPFLVRRSDPEHYLDLGRAAVCTCVEEVLTWWRRPRSGCGGGIILAALDLEPGAGWGLLDSDRNPKAPWWVARRILAPFALLLSDDGLDGVGLDLVNDTPLEVTGQLRVVAHSGLGVTTELFAGPIAVPARSALETGVDELAGRFTDLTHAHGFGPRPFDAVSAEVRGEEGRLIASATMLIGGPGRPRVAAVGLTAELTARSGGDWMVDVSTGASAQWVVIESPNYEPHESWFHMAADTRRRVTLRPRETSETELEPRGRVRALNSIATALFGGVG
jgi:beta-mannosidase